MLGIKENCILEAIHRPDSEAVLGGLRVGFSHVGWEVSSFQLVLLNMRLLHLESV